MPAAGGAYAAAAHDDDVEDDTVGLLGGGRDSTAAAASRSEGVAELAPAADSGKLLRIGGRKGDVALLAALCSSVFFSGCLSACATAASSPLSAKV